MIPGGKRHWYHTKKPGGKLVVSVEGGSYYCAICGGGKGKKDQSFITHGIRTHPREMSRRRGDITALFLGGGGGGVGGGGGGGSARLREIAPP